jgi:serine/threonine protein phosphatase 1
MAKVFAIGDVHGCSKTFRKLLTDQIGIRKSDEVFCVGDYIDRGPDSKGVVDFILELRNEGFQIHTLRGNHEQLMLESTEDSESLKLWFENGGKITLSSFGVSSYADLDLQYREFFEETQYYVIKDKFIFVHAGLDWWANDPFQNTEAMLWSRDPFVDRKKLGDRIIVHGHTTLPKEVILKQTGPNINIDGGCVYPHAEGYGYLVALEVHEQKYYIVRNAEM